MPATVSHVLSATTPDDPAWEIRPSHWNSNHAVAINAVGSEISGAFSNGGNVSFGLSANGFITASANVTAAPSPVNVTGANGSSVNAQTIQFDNANGLTLGVSTAANGATVTGSYTVPVVPTSYVSRVNGSSGAISLNVGSSLSSSTNGSSITFGLASNITTALQSAGAYLTTAAQSNQVVNSLNGSTGQISLNVGSSLSSSANGSSITFGLASNITTALQSAGAYFTTARASNDAIGLNSAVSNVTATINSSGLSLDARGYAGTTTAVTGGASLTLNSGGLQFNGANLAGTTTGFAGANISGSITHNTAGINLSLSVAAPGGGGAFSAGVSGGNTSGDTGATGTRVVFAGGNNVTLSQATNANGATITISAANAGGAQTGISGIVVSNTTYTAGTITFQNANGISFGSSGANGISASYTVPSQTVQPGIQSIAFGNTTFTTGAVSFSNANGFSFGSSGAQVTASYTVPVVPTAYVSSVNGSSGAISLNVGSSLSSSTNGSSITFGLASNITTALQSAGAYLTTARASNDAIGLNSALTANGVSVTANSSGLSLNFPAFLTTARASNDAVGLNTANTNVTWTVNSSGISFNAGGYAGTTSGFTGANISATITHNTAGLALSMSVAAPGAAAENNAIQLLGANTAGNTTASGSTIGWSGVNLTLSGANASQVVISAPATSSLVGASGMSISSAGSTISLYPVARSQWDNNGGLGVAGAQQGNSLVSIQPFMIEWPLVFSNAVFPVSIGSVANAANASTAYVDVTLSAVIYTRNASTLSSLLSFSNSLTQTWSSNATATVTGGKLLTASFAGSTLTPGNYWMALHISTNNTATGGANTTALGNTISMVLGSNISTTANAMAIWGQQTNSSVGAYSGLGIISTGATRASIGMSLISQNGTSGLNAPVAFALRNDTFQ